MAGRGRAAGGADAAGGAGGGVPAPVGGAAGGLGGAVRISRARDRNALTLFRPLGAVESIEIRLHRTVLYNSVYRADSRLLVNQHAYGVPAAQSPVFCLSDTGGEMTALYFDSFDRVWAGAATPGWPSGGERLA